MKGVSNNNTTERDGEFSAYLFDNGIQPDFETEKEQYSSFYAEVILQKDEILKELIDIREENKILNQTITKQNTDWESTFTTQKEEVAKKFDVSIRTIYRNIRKLEEAGIPVLTIEGRGYSLMDN